MKETATIRPPLPTKSGATVNKLSSWPGSSFTAIRKAINVCVAGCSLVVRGTASSITRAKRPVVEIGRARTIALAIFRDLLSSPN